MPSAERFDLDKFIKEAGVWDKKYLRVVMHSIEVYEGPEASPSINSTISQPKIQGFIQSR